MVETDTHSHLRAFSDAALRCLPVTTADGRWDFARHAGVGTDAIAPSGPGQPARRDLRGSHLICSVDPPGCQDIDDALSARLVCVLHVFMPLQHFSPKATM